jgi:hypothetical protein
VVIAERGVNLRIERRPGVGDLLPHLGRQRRRLLGVGEGLARPHHEERTVAGADPDDLRRRDSVLCQNVTPDLRLLTLERLICRPVDGMVDVHAPPRRERKSDGEEGRHACSTVTLFARLRCDDARSPGLWYEHFARLNER